MSIIPIVAAEMLEFLGHALNACCLAEGTELSDIGQDSRF